MESLLTTTLALTLVGTQLLELPHKLVAALDLSSKVQQHLASEGIPPTSRKGKRSKDKVTVEARNDENMAMQKVVASEILELCEKDVSTNEPCHRANKTQLPREKRV